MDGVLERKIWIWACKGISDLMRGIGGGVYGIMIEACASYAWPANAGVLWAAAPTCSTQY